MSEQSSTAPAASSLSRSLRSLVERSIVEAQSRNAGHVDAEHLLLALARDGAPPIRRALAESGLTVDGVESALAAEREASLAVAGVTPPPAERLAASPRLTRPRWGATARDVLVRAHRIAGTEHRQRSAEYDLLAALLSLELGTVPRTLDRAGVDRAALLAAAQQQDGASPA